MIKSLSDEDDDDILYIDQYEYTELAEKKNENESENESESESESESEEETENLLDKDKPIANVLNAKGYKCLRKLCYTDQGSVWKAKSAVRSVVIKIASKLHYEKRLEHEDIIKEIELLQDLNKQEYKSNCVGVINVIDTIENNNNYMVVLENGGTDLFKFITLVHEQIANKKITIGEWQKTVKLISTKLIELINWLHNEMSLCHLDISLENILISNINWISYPDQYKHYKKKLSPNFKLRLIDFGAAQCFKQYDLNGNILFNSKSIIGKPSYCCPEIYKLQNKLTNKSFDARMADTWAFGVCVFVMSIGCPPWTVADETNNKLFQTIVLEKNLDCVLNAWKRSNYINKSMKDLLQKIFVIEEQNRITADNIIKHLNIHPI